MVERLDPIAMMTLVGITVVLTSPWWLYFLVGFEVAVVVGPVVFLHIVFYGGVQ